MKYILLFLLLIPIVFAYPYGEIREQALKLEGIDDYMTIRNINQWIEENTIYEFNEKHQGLSIFWEERIGDCTQEAMLGVYMSQQFNFETRYVHGFADGQKHDWYEVRIDNKWWTPEYEYFKDLRKIGYEIW